MSSFLSKFKTSNTSTTAANGSAAAKKDVNVPQLTALEKLLADAGPDRDDGSDKVFGMENFGSTCYYNSIIQCLYHSPPFRDHILNYPTPLTPLRRRRTAHKHNRSVDSVGESNGSATSPALVRNKSGLISPTTGPPKKTMGPPSQSPQSPIREERKDTSEYKKKMALLNGPMIQLDHGSGTQYGMKESLFTSLRDMFEAMSQHESRSGVVSPRRPTDLVRALNSVFSVPMHQDAHECLNFVLNQIVEDLENNEKDLNEKRKASTTDVSEKPSNGHIDPSNPRWIHELFEGVMSSEITCLTCQRTSSREEAYLDLSVDLGLFSSVNSCLMKFSEEEMLNERNKFHCDSCNGLQEAEKRMKIKKTPNILALHLKRFTYTEDLQRLQKLHHRVAYPYYLRLSNLTDESEDQDKLYELYAVVVHIGMSPYQGHYVSIIKTESSGWLLFDDENVEPVDKDFVRSFFGSESGLACAYVLFYKATTYEAAQRDMDAEDRSSAFLSSVRRNEMPLTTKSNGTAGQVPSTAWTDDPNFGNLDRTISVPPRTTASTSTTSVATSTSPLIPFISRKKSAGASKALLERDESEDGSITGGSQTNVSQTDEVVTPTQSLYTNGSAKVPRKQVTVATNGTSREDGYDGTNWPTTDGAKEESQSNFSLSRLKPASKSTRGRSKIWGSMLGKDAPLPPTPSQAQPTVQSVPSPVAPARTSAPSSPLQSKTNAQDKPPPVPEKPAANSEQPANSSTSTAPFRSMIPPDTAGDAHEPLEDAATDKAVPTKSDRPVTARTVTLTALPTYQPAADAKKKDKRSFFGLGKKKS